MDDVENKESNGPEEVENVVESTVQEKFSKNDPEIFALYPTGPV